MAVVKFTASRQLVSGYLVGDLVTLQFSTMQADIDPRVIQQTKTSLGGAIDRNVDRFENHWQITTTPFEGAGRGMVEMFLQSVKAGEQFTADWDADSDAAATYLFYMLPNSFKPIRLFSTTFKYSFEAQEL